MRLIILVLIASRIFGNDMIYSNQETELNLFKNNISNTFYCEAKYSVDKNNSIYSASASIGNFVVNADAYTNEISLYRSNKSEKYGYFEMILARSFNLRHTILGLILNPSIDTKHKFIMNGDLSFGIQFNNILAEYNVRKNSFIFSAKYNVDNTSNLNFVAYGVPNVNFHSEISLNSHSEELDYRFRKDGLHYRLNKEVCIGYDKLLFTKITYPILLFNVEAKVNFDLSQAYRCYVAVTM